MQLTGKSVPLHGPMPKKLLALTGDVSGVPDGLNTWMLELMYCRIAVPCELVPTAVPMSGGVMSQPIVDSFVTVVIPLNPTSPFTFPAKLVVAAARGISARRRRAAGPAWRCT